MVSFETLETVNTMSAMFQYKEVGGRPHRRTLLLLCDHFSTADEEGLRSFFFLSLFLFSFWSSMLVTSALFTPHPPSFFTLRNPLL